MRSPLFPAEPRGRRALWSSLSVLAAASGLCACVVSGSRSADGGMDLAELQGPTRDLQVTPNDLQLSTIKVTGVSPARGAFEGGDTITVSGESFLRDATVTVAGVAAQSARLLSLSQISVVTPTSPDTLGLVPIEVTNSNGQKAQLTRFRYVAKDLRFTPGARQPFSADEAVNRAALYDFNNDGAPDLLVSQANQDGLILVLSTRGAFASKRYAPTGARPMGVSAGDFDGDGNGDAAVAQHGANSVRVLPGEGFGIFPMDRQVSVATAAQPLALAAADLNGDKRPDLIVLSESGAKVEAVLTSVSQGSLRLENKGGPSLPAAGRALTVADLNGDGRPDVVAVSAGGKLTVLLTQADGSLNKGQEFDGPGDPRGLSLGDISGDGKPDLAVVSPTDGKVAVFRGLGDGTFDVAGRVNYTVGMQPTDVVAVDLDGDGLCEVVTVNSGSDDLTVLRNLGDGTLQQKPLVLVTGQKMGDGGVEDVTQAATVLTAAKGGVQLLTMPLNQNRRADLVSIHTTDNSAFSFLNRSR